MEVLAPVLGTPVTEEEAGASVTVPKDVSIEKANEPILSQRL